MPKFFHEWIKRWIKQIPRDGIAEALDSKSVVNHLVLSHLPSAMRTLTTNNDHSRRSQRQHGVNGFNHCYARARVKSFGRSGTHLSGRLTFRELRRLISG